MKEFTIKAWVKVLSWLCAFIIVGLNVKLVIQEITAWTETAGDNSWMIYVFVLPIIAAIFALLVYVFIAPFIKKQERKVSIVPHGKVLQIHDVEAIQYRSIGITVDFSKNDRNTIRHALIQGGKNAHYYLIHIVETAGARFHGNNVLDLETKVDAGNLEKYRQNLMELGYASTILIGYGTASQAIADLVKHQQMDMLVMGAHGHKGISDLIFGTTVDSVRHHVNIPIFIIK